MSTDRSGSEPRSDAPLPCTVCGRIILLGAPRYRRLDGDLHVECNERRSDHGRPDGDRRLGPAVMRFLAERPGHIVCFECVASAIGGSAEEVQAAILNPEESGFCRIVVDRPCSVCGETRITVEIPT